jgi:hypothetical protein
MKYRAAHGRQISFWAHVQNWPRTGPNQAPTLPSLLLAICSSKVFMETMQGHHAPLLPEPYRCVPSLLPRVSALMWSRPSSSLSLAHSLPLPTPFLMLRERALPWPPLLASRARCRPTLVVLLAASLLQTRVAGPCRLLLHESPAPKHAAAPPPWSAVPALAPPLFLRL